MSKIKIVEYYPEYASSIAEMWNCSNEGWNGHDWSTTADNVIKNESNSSYLNLYLAVEETLYDTTPKVIGYCKLAKYFHDESTLIIHTLNVIPAYHGQKVGKLLMLKAVSRTIELGYPLLELSTWAGNSKAIPLYKKCGFFWEKRGDNSTDFINFIPSVISNELFHDFFSRADWYNDSNRLIDLLPDGKTENRFDYFTYSWQKCGKNLLIEFESSGRGIRRVETDDYLIMVIVQDHQLVFGNHYPVYYELINKSSKPLHISIKGKDDKNISTHISFCGQIEDRQFVEGSFYLDKTEIEQNIRQIHPVVMSEIIVNGKKVIFKSGINTQFPLKIESCNTYPSSLHHTDRPIEIFFNIKNNYDCKCIYTMNFPEHKGITFLEKNKAITLLKDETSSFSTKVVLKNSVLINDDIVINAALDNGNVIYYNQRFHLVLAAFDGIMYGSDDYFYHICFGKYRFTVNKYMEFGEMIFASMLSTEYRFFLTAPKIGKPFSSEFDTTAPCKSEFVDLGRSILLKLYYRSKDFSGCEFIQNFKLTIGGELSQWFEILGFPSDKEELFISQELNLNWDKDKIIMPYDSKLISFNNNTHNDMSLNCLNSDKLTENWIFAEKSGITTALIWPADYRISFTTYSIFIEYRLTRKGILSTVPIVVAIDMLNSVKAVREFALQKDVNDDIIYDSFDLELNKGNPFISRTLNGAFADYKEKCIEADMRIETESEIIFSQMIQKTDNLHKIDFQHDKVVSSRLSLITASADYHSRILIKSKAVFMKTKSSITCTSNKSGNMHVLSANNGVLEIKSSPEFAPSIYSLSYNNNEWLDSEFPNLVDRSWWKSWFGGICNKLSDISAQDLIAERTITQFVTRRDNFENDWEGIEISTCIEKVPDLKGITIKQHFLMLPGVPVICTYLQIEQNSQSYKELEFSIARSYLKSDNDCADITAKVIKNGQENIIRKKDGVGFSFNSQLLAYSVSSRKEKLYFYDTNPVSKGYCENDLFVVSCSYNEEYKIKNGDTKVLPPKFIIFSELELKEDDLIDLRNIKFVI